MKIKKRIHAGFVMMATLTASEPGITAEGLVAAARAPLFAVLSGGNEVSAVGDAAAGDPEGFGSATVTFVGPARICYALTVSGTETPTAAHIHNNVAGKNGVISVPLTPPVTVNGRGTSSACIAVDKTLVSQLRAFPGAFYVNIHTAEFPGGAVRGQLF
jgi:hypothetical protein